MFNLTKDNIIKYAQKYDEIMKGSFDEYGEKELKEWLSNNRYLEKEKFVRLGKWKSRRPTKHYESNSDDLIREVTKLSLSTENEEVRIKILRILKGVSWPVASVILHFAFPDKYTIMDYRAIWSLGWELPKAYNFKFWQEYCQKIRDIAKECGTDLRTVDKALWQYSRENQK